MRNYNNETPADVAKGEVLQAIYMLATEQIRRSEGLISLPQETESFKKLVRQRFVGIHRQLSNKWKIDEIYFAQED